MKSLKEGIIKKLLKREAPQENKDYLLIQKTNYGSDRETITIFIHKSNIEKIRLIERMDENNKKTEIVQIHLKSGEPITAQKGSDSIFFISENDLKSDINSISHVNW